MEDWKKQYRDLMEGHEKPAPEGLWESVSSAVGTQRRKMPVFYYMAGAVAAALVIGVLIFRQAGAGPESVTGLERTAAVLQDTLEIEIAPIRKPSSLIAMNTLPETGPVTTEDIRPEQEDSADPDSAVKNDEREQDEGLMQDTNGGLTKDDEQGQNADDEQTKDIFDGQEQDDRLSQDPDVYSDPFKEEKTSGKRRPVRIGAAVSGIAHGSTSSASSPVILSDAAPFGQVSEQFRSMDNVLAGTEIDTKYRHRQPVKFMITVSVPLNDRLSFDTGLSYSRHHSDIITYAGGTEFDSSRMLNYIGIPAGLSCTFLQNKNLRLYAGAGTMTEKMIYGTIEPVNRISSANRVRMHGLQFSLYGIAGAEMRLSPMVGLALEPGLGYYFPAADKGISTIYSDRPLNFELRLALRLDL